MKLVIDSLAANIILISVIVIVIIIASVIYTFYRKKKNEKETSMDKQLVQSETEKIIPAEVKKELSAKPVYTPYLKSPGYPQQKNKKLPKFFKYTSDGYVAIEDDKDKKIFRWR